jgi:hypothetical protein
MVTDMQALKLAFELSLLHRVEVYALKTGYIFFFLFMEDVDVKGA